MNVQYLKHTVYTEYNGPVHLLFFSHGEPEMPKSTTVIVYLLYFLKGSVHRSLRGEKTYFST